MRRLREKIRQGLKAEAGDGTIYAAILVLVMLILFLVVSEYMRISATAVTIQNAMDEAVRHVITDNWEEVFPGTREGYGGSVNPNVLNEKSVISEVADIVNASYVNNATYEYSIDGQTVYNLQELELSMYNDSFVSSNFSVKAVAEVELPFLIGSIGIFPITLELEAEVEFVNVR